MGVRSLGTWPVTAGTEEKGEKKTLIPQNRFEMLSSRVMRCEVEIRKQERDRKEEGKAISCFKCKEEGH